jgi:SAM-dependent methyltransferase
MNEPPITKFEHIKNYLKKNNYANFSGCKIIDVGGFSAYYQLLTTLFSQAELYVLNIDKHELKGVPSIVGDARQLPFNDSTWDVVISFELLEHIPDRAELLISESFRVLINGGLFILAIANLADLYSRIAFLFGYAPFHYDASTHKVGSLSPIKTTTRGHKSVFTYKGAKELLVSYGFQIVESHGYTYIDPFYWEHGLRDHRREVGYDNIRRLFGAILPTSLSEGMLFISKKPD